METKVTASHESTNANRSRGDVDIDWPSATVALMGAVGASKFLDRRELDTAADPLAFEKQKAAEYEATFNNHYKLAARSFLDDVIEPHTTRPYLIRALDLLKTKHEERPLNKHGNIPL